LEGFLGHPEGFPRPALLSPGRQARSGPRRPKTFKSPGAASLAQGSGFQARLLIHPPESQRELGIESKDPWVTLLIKGFS